jgi:type II secretory pathway pseudopilin PulG
MRSPWPSGRRAAGFSLLELLLAACLGLLLWGVMLRLLMAEGDQGARLARLARERLWQRRSLDLIRADLRRAERVEVDSAGNGAACPMAGRRPVLHLHTDTGPITYAVGPPPSPIWRGQVLLRCGPAFDLHGVPSGADPLNRVLLDGLSPQGLTVEAQEEGLLRLELEQSLPRGGGASQRIATTMHLPAPLADGTVPP